MNNEPMIETRARDAFRASCDNLDATTLADLRRARSNALSAPARGSSPMLWFPVGAMAALALALVFVWQRPAPRGATAMPAAVATTADAAATSTRPPVSDDDVDLYNNLDFYAWLASQPKVASGVN